MKIKFCNADEDTIIAKTMLAPWHYTKINNKEIMILDIHPSYINEALFIDLDEANIDYQIISDDEEDAFYSALEALRESIAKINESIGTSVMSSTIYTDALKAFEEEVEDYGE